MDAVVVEPELEDLIPGYLANRRRDIAAIKTAIANADYARARILGHSMRGSGGGYGFPVITEIGASLEVAALAEDTVAIEAACGRLLDYLDHVQWTVRQV